MHFLAGIFAFITGALVWLAGLVMTAAGAIVAYFAVIGLKKILLTAIYVTAFVAILTISNLAISNLLTSLINQANFTGPVFLGLSYVMPPNINTAISAMVSARIIVWVYIQSFTILKLVQES